jgi:hypothetical protein
VPLDVMRRARDRLLEGDRPGRGPQRRRRAEALRELRRHALGHRAELVGADAALARAHRHGRVALQELRGVEALGDAGLDLLHAHVLAEADHAVGAARARAGGLERVEGGTARGLDACTVAARARLVEREPAAGRVAGDDDGEVVREAHEVLVRLDRRPHHEQVAREAAAAGRHAAHPLAARRRGHGALDDLAVEAARVDVAGSDDRHDLDPGAAQRADVLERLRLLGPDDRARAGRDAVDAGEPRGAAREHHAGQVVPRKDAVRLAAAAGEHDRARVDVERLVAAHGDEQRPLVEAGRGAPPRRLDALVRGDPRRELVDGVARRARRHARAGLGLVEHEHPRRARARGRERGREAGDARADDEHVRVVVDPLQVARGVVVVDDAEARDLPHERLDHRPRELRPDAGLVVEADRQGPVHVVDHGEGVAVGRRPRVLALHRLALARRALARAHVDLPVDGHEAVRAVARHAVEAARAVVLEGARERAHAVAEEGGGDGVAPLDRDVAPLEVDRRHALTDGSRRRPPARRAAPE